MQWDGATIGWQDQCLKMPPRAHLSPIQAFAPPPTTTPATRSFKPSTAARIVQEPRHRPAPQPRRHHRRPGLGCERESLCSAVRRFFDQDHETIVDGDEVDERGDAFERKLLDVFEAGIPGVELTFIVSRSFGDEFGAAIQSDLGLLQAAFMLILAYAGR